jgi:hypothetical protein
MSETARILLPPWVEPLLKEICTASDPEHLGRYLTALVVADYEQRMVGRRQARRDDYRLRALLKRAEVRCSHVVTSSWGWDVVREQPLEFLDWLTEVDAPVLVPLPDRRGLVMQTPQSFREVAKWVELAQHYLRSG